jgi:hypothetical protein
LVAIDGERLLIVYTIGADPSDAGTASVGRLRAAIANVNAPGLLTPFSVDAGPDAAMPADGVSQHRPAATRLGDAVYVGWTNSSRDGSVGDRVFLSEVGSISSTALTFGAARTLPLGASEQTPWQSNLRLGASSLFPGGAVIAVWERAMDASALTTVDLMLDLRPSPFVFLK